MRSPDSSPFATARFAYAMVRVRNLERSLDFYVRQLGMTLSDRQDYSEGRFTLAFVGYVDQGTHATAVELTHNWDQDDTYTHGTGFGHLAIHVPDVFAACVSLEAAGTKVVRPPGPMKFSDEVIAFVLDPDGYRIELVGGHP